MSSLNPYDILEVSRTASKEVISASYRTLAKKYHPDASSGNNERMREINWAYELLTDDIKRAQWDRENPLEAYKSETKRESDSKVPTDSGAAERSSTSPKPVRRRSLTPQIVFLLLFVIFAISGLFLRASLGRELVPSTSTSTSHPLESPSATLGLTKEPKGTRRTTIAEAELVYSDDFSDSNSGWFVGVDEFGEARYQDGGYFVAPPVNPGSWSTTDSPNNESFTDMSVEVEAAKLGGPDQNEYGLYCRLSADPVTFYLGLIGNDGIYAIYERLAEEDWALIAGGDAGSLTLNADWNHLRLDCIGSTISLYVNGELVAEGTDNTLTAGEAGVYTGTLNESGVEILFDNFAVYLP